MECRTCSAGLPDRARFCLACGADQAGPRPSPGGASQRDETAVLQDLVARTLAGRYAVRQLLGSGGMASVFLADDLTLERTVAIKVLPTALAHDERVVTRFQREAKTAAKLDHPHIIPIYRVESEGILNYFVMKFVPGRSLERLLSEDGPLDLTVAERIVLEAATALGHAHHRGVVHRDVKPANIMLDADDQVILMDFGISKAAESTAELTQTGTILGTPTYMAPEQVMGRPVDGRADQYALAVVAYQLVTGRLPFDGETAHAVLYQHVHETPTTPSTLRAALPARVDAAILRGLAKDPADRFPRVEEFAAMLCDVPAASIIPARSRGLTPRVPPAAVRGSGAETVRTPDPLRGGEAPASRPERPGSRSAAGRSAAAPNASPSASGATRPLPPSSRVRPATRRWIAVAATALVAVAGASAWARSRPRPIVRNPSVATTSDSAGAASTGGMPAAADTSLRGPTGSEAGAQTPADPIGTPVPQPPGGEVDPVAARAQPTAPADVPLVTRHAVHRATVVAPIAVARAPAAQDAKRTAALTVNSEPWGTLYIDGVEVGPTPVAEYALAVGRTYEIRVDRDGYRSRRETVTVAGPNEIRRRYVLEPGAAP